MPTYRELGDVVSEGEGRLSGKPQNHSGGTGGPKSHTSIGMEVGAVGVVQVEIDGTKRSCKWVGYVFKVSIAQQLAGGGLERMGKKEREHL